jgi:methylenetetrahydrofolate reductase (NADPH)
VNGVKSSDPVYGWGPERGYIYQKAYFEFFLPEELLPRLIAHLQKFEMISYQAVNQKGKVFSNVKADDVNAVTWGIFMNKEVI